MRSSTIIKRIADPTHDRQLLAICTAQPITPWMDRPLADLWVQHAPELISLGVGPLQQTYDPRASSGMQVLQCHAATMQLIREGGDTGTTLVAMAAVALADGVRSSQTAWMDLACEMVSAVQ
jgi:hypothetical protein